MSQPKIPEQNTGTPKIWHPQQEKVLKSWGEQSACYRYMHFKSYQRFKNMSIRFTLPVIVLSTITGTANFAQDTFPPAVRPYAPLVIGGLNLIAAIMTTIAQFLKVSELTESHRVSSVDFGKLSRSIRLQLSLPVFERANNGSEFLEMCRGDFDRLVAQCPSVPGKVIKSFEQKFPTEHVRKLNKNKQELRQGWWWWQKCATDYGVDDDDNPRHVNLDRPEILKLTEIDRYSGEAEVKLMQKGAAAFRRNRQASESGFMNVIRTLGKLKRSASDSDIETGQMSPVVPAPAPVAVPPPPVPEPPPPPVAVPAPELDPDPTPAESVRRVKKMVRSIETTPNVHQR